VSNVLPTRTRNGLPVHELIQNTSDRDLRRLARMLSVVVNWTAADASRSGGCPRVSRRHAFIWSEATGMLDLNDRLDRTRAGSFSIELRRAKAINEFGWIAAEGIDNREVQMGRNNLHTYALIPQIAPGIPHCR